MTDLSWTLIWAVALMIAACVIGGLFEHYRRARADARTRDQHSIEWVGSSEP